VKDGGGNVTGQPGQVFVALELRARLPFLGLYLASAGWATMRRVTRSESAATLRSSSVLR
jgi:hypothetical protein